MNKDTFVIEIAGHGIEIRAKYGRSRELCRDFICDRLPELCVEVSEDEVLKQAKQAPSTALGDMESLCIYKKIGEWLPLQNCFIFHGAAISYGENGYLFSAPSGTGKSTHIRLWRECFSEAVQIINGDKPVIEARPDGTLWLHASPWAGKENWKKNRSAPLKGVCILSQSVHNHIEKVQWTSYITQLIPQMNMPNDKNALEKSMALFKNVFMHVKLYHLKCNMDQEAAFLAQKTMYEKT